MKVDLYQLAKDNNILNNATIELLTRCNWRCQHCYIPEHNNSGLSTNEWFNILHQLRAIGCFDILFTGGEPFYRDDIMDIIGKARELFFNVSMFTNISLLNENIIKTLSDLKVSRISCSIFSLDEDIHDSISGVKGSLKKSLNNAFLLKKYNIPLEIKTVLMGENQDSYEELYEFCNEHNFKYLATTSLFSRIDGDNKPNSFKLDTDYLKTNLLKIDKIRGTNVKQEITDENYICNSPHHSIFIDCNGLVYPCNNMRNLVGGDLSRQSLEDIWYHSENLNYLKELRWKDLEYCNNCNDKEYCLRCAGIALLENNDILSKDYGECIHARIRHHNCQHCL